MFLYDLAEFERGRKVTLHKYHPQVGVTSIKSGLVKNGYNGSYLTGSLENLNSTGNLNSIDNGKIVSQNGIGSKGSNRHLTLHLKEEGKHVGSVYKSRSGKQARIVVTTPDKKPIRKPKPTTTLQPTTNKINTTPPTPQSQSIKTPTPTPVKSTPKPSAKKSSKFINKYSLGALGAAGVLGGGYLGYRAYQNRKQEGKK